MLILSKLIADSVEIEHRQQEAEAHKFLKQQKLKAGLKKACFSAGVL